MSALLQGEMLSQDRLWRSWGKRQWTKPAPSGKSPLIHTCEPGFITVVRSAFVNHVYKGVAVSATPLFRVRTPVDKTHVMFIPSGVEVKAAGELNLSWLPGSPGAGVHQGENATAVLPDMAFDQGYELEWDSGANEGEGEVSEAWLLIDLFELPRDHSNAEVPALLDHIHKLTEALEHHATGS